MEYEKILEQHTDSLHKALAHLSYSYQKIQGMDTDVSKMDDEQMETWESFAIRFARTSDIFMQRYLKTKVLLDDPGFKGSLRDFVNQAEKLGYLDDANAWMGIRELRNISAHEYSEQDMTMFYARLRDECPRLLAIKESFSS